MASYSFLPCAVCLRGSQQASEQSMPCSAHTNGKYTCRLFCMIFTFLRRFFLPSLILFLLTMVGHILLVLLLLVLVVALLLSFVCNGVELGVQLELAFECIEGGSHSHNLFVVWGYGIKLVLRRGHEGLVDDGGEFAIEVALMLIANVRLEVVAGNHKVSLKKDANWVVNGCTPGD